jgi:RNA polymerase sigma factor (sigma-70 family)
MKIEHFMKINLEAKKTMEYSPFNSFDDFWRRVVEKNEIAWGIIQNHYSKIMHCYLYRKGIPHEEAKDIIQNAYMKFWKKTRDPEFNFSDDKALLVYLLKICERETIEYLRNQFKRATGISLYDLIDENMTVEAFEQSCHTKRVEARDILNKIVNILKQRPHGTDHLEIFEDYYFKGIPTDIIAKKYNKTPANIRVILHRQRMFILSKLTS